VKNVVARFLRLTV